MKYNVTALVLVLILTALTGAFILVFIDRMMSVLEGAIP